MARYRILSIDGGGVNVLMSLLLLHRIESKRKGFLAACDLFAGTSAGGISAMILAANADPAVGLEKAITFWEKSLTFLRQPGRTVAGMTGATSLLSNGPLRKELQAVLGTTTLGQLPHRVLVASIQLDNKDTNDQLRGWRPRSLSNLAIEGGIYLQGRAVDIALRSAAAPVVWPVYQGYVDGGLFANDPSMLALTRVLDERRDPAVAGGHARDVLADITLFSVGEGQVPHHLQVGTASWGVYDWLLHRRRRLALLELALNSTAEAISEQCRMLLGDNQYFRLNPDIKPLTGRTMQLSDPISYAETLARRMTSSLEEIFDPVRVALDHARDKGKSYDIDPVFPWIDRSGWMKGRTPPPPTPP